MELTVGYLKKVFEHLDDDIVLASLNYFNDDFSPFINVKRLLVLRDISEKQEWGGRTFLTINKQGSHFTGEGKQKPLQYISMSFDSETFNSAT